MGDINRIMTIVKLLEEPRKKILSKPILISEARAQFPQVRKKNIQKLVNLTFWGSLSQAMLNYYKADDYLIIEGYVSVKNESTAKLSFQFIEVTVLKVYPFFLTTS